MSRQWLDNQIDSAIAEFKREIILDSDEVSTTIHKEITLVIIAVRHIRHDIVIFCRSPMRYRFPSL